MRKHRQTKWKRICTAEFALACLAATYKHTWQGASAEVLEQSLVVTL
jgi:hypothetical protein